MLVDSNGLDYNSSSYHRVDGCGVGWQVMFDGIHVEHSDKPRRTRGEPTTLQRINDQFGDIIRSACAWYPICAEAPMIAKMRMIAALIATESGGNPNAERSEPTIKDWSFGLCQVLTKTASALSQKPFDLPPPPSPLKYTQAKSVSEWRRFFSSPTNSVRYAIAYFYNINSLRITDPIVLYAIYNAGGAYFSGSNTWGLRSAPGALDRFAAWYGDACEVFR